MSPDWNSLTLRASTSFDESGRDRNGAERLNLSAMPAPEPLAARQTATVRRPRILLVDDNDAVRVSLAALLEHGGFAVFSAADVNGALRLIAAYIFDVLLSDLHMPGAGDGLTVVSAMRHSNPKAITIIFSGYPEMKEAAAAILLQADEILVKPVAPTRLIEIIKEKLEHGASTSARVTQTVAYILEQNTQAAIGDWLRRVEAIPDVLYIPLRSEDRCAHLPHLFQDLIARLRAPLALGARSPTSPAAAIHGLVRREQGYTAAMLVEESRILQVSIFQTLQNNLHQVDFSLLLLGVMAIADEVDSQLAQAMTSFVAGEPKDGHLPSTLTQHLQPHTGDTERATTSPVISTEAQRVAATKLCHLDRSA